MNALILNRAFEHPEDGWYQIEPKGDHPNRDAGIVQVIDDQAAENIINRFNAAADKPNFAGMLIDHEHFKHDTDKETIAYGWLTRLENRADGIYGQIRWTTTGKAAVDGGDYRFFSTEYDPADLKVLNATGKSRRVRPLRLDGLTLTNNPNNKGQKPITNRRPALAEPADEPTTKNKKMKQLLTAMGLSAEASEETALTEWSKIKNRLDLAEKDLPIVKNRVTELETSNKTLLDEQIDALLDGYVGADNKKPDEKVRNRLKPVLAVLKNREERVGTLTDFGFKAVEPGKTDKSAQTRVLNRGTGQADTAAVATEGDESAKVDKIRNRATELKKSGLGFDAAWAQAVSENNAGK